MFYIAPCAFAGVRYTVADGLDRALTRNLEPRDILHEKFAPAKLSRYGTTYMY